MQKTNDVLPFSLISLLCAQYFSAAVNIEKFVWGINHVKLAIGKIWKSQAETSNLEKLSLYHNDRHCIHLELKRLELWMFFSPLPLKIVVSTYGRSWFTSWWDLLDKISETPKLLAETCVEERQEMQESWFEELKRVLIKFINVQNFINLYSWTTPGIYCNNFVFLKVISLFKSPLPNHVHVNSSAIIFHNNKSYQ